MTRLLEVKWLCFAAMLALLFATVAQGRTSRTTFEKMKPQVLSAADVTHMGEGDAMMLRRLYGLDKSAYQGVVLYYPATNMGAEELLLVQLSDADQQEEVLEAIQTRLDAQKTNFDGYGALQMDMLSHSAVEAKGGYVLFVSAADPAAVRTAFLDAL